MGYKLTKKTPLTSDLDTIAIFDHFDWYVTAHLWTAAVVATGTVTNPATGGSLLQLLSAADNDAAVLATTNELFKYTAGKAMYCEGTALYSTAGSTAFSAAFGWADAMAATTVADTTGAITATDACVIHAINGSLFWRFHTETNGTAVATLSTTAITGTQVLSIEVTPRSSTELEARPFVDGVQLKDSGGTKIMHVIQIASATDMDFGWVFKGHHADDMNIKTDYVYASQAR